MEQVEQNTTEEAVPTPAADQEATIPQKSEEQAQTEPQPQGDASPPISYDPGEDVVSHMVERDITVDLTDKEVADLGRKAAEMELELKDIEDEKKKAVSEFNERIAKKEKSIRDTLEKIREGKTTDHRMVKEERDFKNCAVRTYTGPNFDVLVEERPMHSSEYQKDLFIRRTPEEKAAMEAEAAQVSDQEFEAKLRAEAAEFKGEEPAPIVIDKPYDESADIRSVMREETSRHTKHSSVDGPTG